MRGAANRLRGFAVELSKFGAARAVILMYHRIADAERDPWGLAVSPRNFAEQLAVLRDCGTPLTLPALAAAHERGTIPRRAIVVTFDDGYADNLHAAKPLLERHDVPATVFVTTGHTGTQDEFWWDELERLLLAPVTLPAMLYLAIGGRARHWDLGGAATYGDDERRRDVGRRARDGAPGSRPAFYYAVWSALLPVGDDERRALLAAIASWAAGGPPRASHRALRADEIVELARGGLVDVGAHTVTHPLFPAHPPAVQRDELVASKSALEEIVGRPVTTFAYPYGESSADSPALVRSAGFVCACSVRAEAVWKRSDRYRLPRFGVEDWSGDELARRLDEWLTS